MLLVIFRHRGIEFFCSWGSRKWPTIRTRLRAQILVCVPGSHMLTFRDHWDDPIRDNPDYLVEGGPISLTEESYDEDCIFVGFWIWTMILKRTSGKKSAGSAVIIIYTSLRTRCMRFSRFEPCRFEVGELVNGSND